MQIALTMPVWAEFSQDSVEGPKGFKAGLPLLVGTRTAMPEPSPIRRAAILRMEGVPQVLKDLEP